MFIPSLFTVWCLAASVDLIRAQDSETLVRFAGGAAETFNSIIDAIWRRPISQGTSLVTGRSFDNTGVYRAQRAMSDRVPFMCGDGVMKRSLKPPTSIHRLRPGDIDVIAAMGDSLTAGNGPMAHDIARLVINNRGLSFAIGGQGTWRQYLTLPNIIKQFNPKLVGFSTGDGYSYSKAAGLNVAVSGAITPDLPHQARVLVKRMRMDPRVNMTHHWKLITVLVGSNDICIYTCYNSTAYSGEAHINNIKNALDFIFANVPRVFVNLVLQPELSALRHMEGKTTLCRLAHYIECPCMFGAFKETKAILADKMVKDYRRQEVALISSGRYERNDFTVELQPFTEHAMTENMKHTNKMDMDLFAIDCFHLSQKGNAYAANALWNNMLEADYTKSRTWSPEFERVLCPTRDAPFLFTHANSKVFQETGKQFTDEDESIVSQKNRQTKNSVNDI